MGRKVRIATLLLLFGLVVGALVLGESEGLPELHLYKLVLDKPSPVIRGEKVVVQAWVMNSGDRPADGFTMEFFYRHREGRNWVSFELVPVSTLAPSRQHPLKETAIFNTSDGEPGTYELRVVVDSNNRIPEGDELNNELVTTLIVLPSKVGLPDLQPLELTFDPTSPSGGQPVKVSTLLINNGDKDAGLFRVSFQVDKQEFDFRYVDWMSVGATMTVEGALNPDDKELNLKPGSHEIAVVVDDEAQIDEQDEENNTLTGYMTIRIAELHPASLAYDQPRLHLDGSTTVSSRIQNTGLGKAEKVEVAFTLNNERFALVTLGPLGPMEESTAEAELIPANLTHQLDAGDYELAVLVDPSNLVTELDEANNRIIKSLTLLEAEVRSPELHPESLEINPPSPVELGRADSVTISSVLKNTGKVVAEGFDVSFSYRVKGAIHWQTIPCSDEVSCTRLSLNPGEERKVEGRLPVFVLPPGIYEIRVDIDSMGTIEELDETNNELVTTLTLLSSRLPDLISDGVEVAPSYMVKRGQTLRFLANIVNLGDLAAGQFKVEFAYCRLPEPASPEAMDQVCAETDFVTFARVSLPELGIGRRGQAQAILETTSLRPGTYHIRVLIDPTGPGKPEGEVKEQKEGNNILNISILLQGADLTPINLQLKPASPVIQGEITKVTATVQNIGVEPIGKFDVNFYWCRMVNEASCTREGEWASLGGVSFPGIAVNNPEPATRELDTSTLEPGTYLLRVIVDPDNRAEEQSEINNELTTLLVIQQRL
ncbi:hypothetical protein KAX17_07565, partial [Candidatus Bipolaricaulota bacterium]|nr:hypothetical protein [Candidatus Bipolaricaulota bacterium]